MRTNRVLKYALFVFCYLFWVASGLLIAIGIYAKLAKEADAVDYLTADPALLLIIVGSLMFSITFLGCFGALRDMTILLKLFAYLLVIILVLQIIAALLGFLFSRMVVEKAENLMRKAITKYRDDLDLQNLIDFIQKKFECCGVGSFRDWSENVYFSCKDDNPSLERCAVPFSCCIQDKKVHVLNTMCGYGTQNLEAFDVEQKIYIDGCLHQIVNWGRQNLLMIGGIALVLLAVEILLICMTTSLIYQIKFVMEKKDVTKSFLR
ncbi:tetraspanin-33-like [Protopterus annectens]|uniref:tetraspanin-33-like n=1 Tax=Protopterus annectens TaxID=7888 RepID=UPI001CFB795F|nr:tetraspanin-33-like [Protopterus annectens]